MADKMLSSKWTKLWFALSATAFMGLEISIGSTIGAFLNILLTFAVVLVLESKYSMLNRVFELRGKKYALISLLIAAYFLCEVVVLFQERYIERAFTAEHPLAVKVRESLPEILLWLGRHCFSVFAAMGALFFVFAMIYAVVSRFESVIMPSVKECWKNTDKVERYYLIAGFIIIAVSLPIIYNLTNVFYSEHILLDRLYGTDTSHIVGVDSLFYFPERNNVNRLMFCLFNLPIALTGKLASRVLFFIPMAYPLTTQILTASLFLLSGVMLARLTGIKGLPKLLSLLIYSFSFSVLFFSLNIDRYVLPTFCVILAVYLWSTDKRHQVIGIIAAASTLTTSLAFIPIGTFNKKIKLWIINMLKIGLYMLILIILYGKFSVLFGAVENISQFLGKFSNSSDFQGSALQFLAFVESVFVFPDTELGNELGFAAYGEQCGAFLKLAAPTAVSLIGVALLAAAVLSAILNRKNKAAIAGIAWVGLSIIVLLLIGWQDGEKFLCSTYFGWAYFLLAVMLVEKLLGKYTVIKSFVYLAALAGIMASSIPGIMYVVNFGIEYFPV